MLDKKSKYVLNLINKLEYIENVESLSKQTQKYTYDEILESLFYLRKNKFIGAFPAENSLFDIEPTYEGKHYNEFSRIKFKDFLFKSVLIPIFLSIATTLITIAIYSLLGVKM